MARQFRRVVAVLWACASLGACDGAGGATVGALPGSGPDDRTPDHAAGPVTVPPAVEHIVAGRVDEADVAVVALTTGGRTFCSGTLVARRTVFTAGHCVVESGLDASQVRVYFGTRVGGPGVSVAVVGWGAHPGYQVLPDGVPLHDVAYVTLGADAPVAPLPWQATRLPSLVGTRVRMVGYGVTDARHQTGSGTRRAVIQTILDQDAGFLYYGDGVSGTCQGDSGGPTLAKPDGVTTLVAVTSYGDETCVQLGVNTRVDANAPFLAAHVDPPGIDPAPVEPSATDVAPIAAEVEPNNGYGGASQPLDGPCTVEGLLAPVGDVDYYRVVLPWGATLSATLAATPADEGTSVRDVDVRLSSSGGDLLAAGENGPGQPEDVAWTNVSTSSRVVYLRVYGLYDEGAEGPWEVAYVLTVSW